MRSYPPPPRASAQQSRGSTTALSLRVPRGYPLRPELPQLQRLHCAQPTALLCAFDHLSLGVILRLTLPQTVKCYRCSLHDARTLSRKRDARIGQLAIQELCSVQYRRRSYIGADAQPISTIVIVSELLIPSLRRSLCLPASSPSSSALDMTLLCFNKNNATTVPSQVCN